MAKVILRRIWHTGVAVGSLCYLLLVLYYLIGFFTSSGFSLDSVLGNAMLDWINLIASAS